MIDILASKYGHNVDEMLSCIRLDERWVNALEHPLVKSMSYFDQQELEDVVAANEAAIAAVADAARMPGAKAGPSTPITELEASEPTVKVKKSRKVVAPAVEEAAPAAEEEPAAEKPAAEKPKPAKKVSKKKVTAAEEVAPVEEAVAEEAAAEEPKPAKKVSKKKVAATEPEVAAPAPAPEVDELVAAVSGMSLSAVEETETAAKPKTNKKVVSKKPTKV